ncbi:MAG: 2-keto-4-pentenoate hydratase [Thiolinea sp.]
MISDIEHAAGLLKACWQEGSVIDYVKGSPWPETVAAGYNTQAELARLRSEPVIGWKIAATALVGRQHINVDRPLAGRLYPSICHADGDTVPFRDNRMAVAEAEFVFKLGADLPPRETKYTADEVAACITALHPGLELPDSRFRDFTQPGTATLIADNACARNFVLGAATTVDFDPQALTDHKTALYINDELATEGQGSDVLEGPLDAMVWITNTLSELRIGLKAGQFVTTGVTGKPMPVKVGDHVRADLGIYGSVSAVLGA